MILLLAYSREPKPASYPLLSKIAIIETRGVQPWGENIYYHRKGCDSYGILQIVKLNAPNLNYFQN